MTKSREHRSYSQFRRGFTLVEVLVAIAILLIGVIAALKIFPAGFNAFEQIQQGNTGLELLQSEVNNLEKNPGTFDAIYPIDFAYPPDWASTGGVNFFADLHAVDWRTGDAWFTRHLAPSGPGRWPLGQPLSVRTMRRVVGENTVIPSDVFRQMLCIIQSVGGPTQVDVDDAANITVGMTVLIDNISSPDEMAEVAGKVGNQLTFTLPVTAEVGASLRGALAFTPKYLLRFGPALANGYWDGGTSSYVADANPVVIYDVRYRRVSLAQLGSLLDRLNSLSDDLYYAIDYANKTLYFLPDNRSRSVRIDYQYLSGRIKQDPSYPAITVPAAANLGALVQVPVAVPGGGEIIAGSDQLNRAYQRDTTNPYNLHSGYYYIDVAANNVITAPIYFSKDDAGRAVKIDYTVADWSIVRENLTVDDDGYVTLALHDPKLRNVPVFPREPSTWGLYAPMQDGVGNIVMEFVDPRSGAVYEVNTLNPSSRNPQYSISTPGAASLVKPAAFIDLSKAPSGRIRLAAADSANKPDWQSLRGQTFRVYYRAQRDWTLQIYRPPSVFWFRQVSGAPSDLQALTDLGWSTFACLIGSDSDSDRQRIAVPSIYAGQSIAVDYMYKEGAAADLPMLRVSGEVHSVPAPPAGAKVSLITLNHPPMKNTVITVRGVSITVRALWIEPRSGPAYTFESANPPRDRPFNERWKEKAMTVILSSGGQ